MKLRPCRRTCAALKSSPFAWVINQSFAEAQTTDPLLRARGAAERPSSAKWPINILRAPRLSPGCPKSQWAPTTSSNFFTNQNSFTPRIDRTTYVYEPIHPKAGAKPRYFEIKQSMDDAPLTKHPETGEPIRRVVLGGFGTLSSKGGSRLGFGVRMQAGNLLRLIQPAKQGMP